MAGDDAKPPFRVYRGRGDEAADPIEERARANAAGAPPASPVVPPAAPPEEPSARPRRDPPTSRPAPPPGRPGVVVLPEDQPPRPPGRPPSRRARPPRRRLRPWRLILLAVLGAIARAAALGRLRLLAVPWFHGRRQQARRRAHARRAHARRLACSRTPRRRSCSDPTARPDGGPGRSDSILLVRVDPGRNRIAELSIPRDLRVTIPGHGDDRINAAYTLGGPALAIQTVRALTGIPINHVVLVDFSGFRELVDALGGRDHRQPDEDHLEQLRRAPLALRARPPAPRRPPRPRVCARAREHRQRRRQRPHARAATAARAAGDRAAAWPRPAPCCTCRTSAARSASRSPPTSRPTT